MNWWSRRRCKQLDGGDVMAAKAAGEEAGPLQVAGGWIKPPFARRLDCASAGERPGHLLVEEVIQTGATRLPEKMQSFAQSTARDQPKS